jgi:hypothetical protein
MHGKDVDRNSCDEQEEERQVNFVPERKESLVSRKLSDTAHFA